MNDGFAKLSRRAGSELTSLLMLYIMLFAEGFMVRLARFESLVDILLSLLLRKGVMVPNNSLVTPKQYKHQKSSKRPHKQRTHMSHIKISRSE